ncbi:MAG: CHASE2 domain-containing protein [Candidatus Dojkabacteria bacterium]
MNLTKIFRPLLSNLVVLALIWIVFSIPFLWSLNNLFWDRLQGGLPPSSEIVVIGIDDATLTDIGAWPWTRDVFADFIDNLEVAKPKAVAMDILFFEEREGDEQFEIALIESEFPVVLGSKLVDGELLESGFFSGQVEHGYVNFVPDSDGKIRRTTIASEIDGKCNLSFSATVYRQFLSAVDTPECGEQVTVASGITHERNLIFNYSGADFTYVSFKDIYNNEFEPSQLEDKILLVGATPIDLKSNLLDNFTDVLGRTTPGVMIHASILNSFIQGQFRNTMSGVTLLMIMAAVTSVILLIYQRIKKNIYEFGIFIGALIALNILGIIIYLGGLNWPFFTANVLLSVSYVFYIGYKYFVESKEKRFIKKAFERYVNPELLDQLVKKPGQLELGGQKKIISVLFSDIRGFTTVSEKLSVEQLITLTNDYFDMQTNVILQNQGTIDKFIGDAIMAFWNAPLDDANHQILAIRAGLAMQQSLIEFNKQRPNLPEIKVGVGINTDEMIVGNIGSRKRFDYTLIGDGVNLASRVEGLTKQYKVGVIVTENVIAELEIKNESFVFRMLDSVKVKGKNQAVKLYEARPKTEQAIAETAVYHDAFNLYAGGQFKEAQAKFLELPNDEPAKMMVKRIQGLTPEQTKDWKGVWEWKHK